MKKSGEIRKAARDALRDNWGNAVGVTAIYYGIFIASYLVMVMIMYIAAFAVVFSTIPKAIFSGGELTELPVTNIGIFIGFYIISLIVGLAFSSVYSNLILGQSRFCLNLAGAKQAKVSDIFSNFNRRYLKGFGLMMLMEFKAALWMMLMYIPSLIAILAGAMLPIEQVVAGAVLTVLGVFGIIGSIVLFTVALLRYAMAPFVFMDEPGIGAFAAVKRSKQLMRGHKAEYLILGLTFIGWYLLAAFTCGIGYLFLIPYVMTASAVFYNELKNMQVPNFGNVPPQITPNSGESGTESRNESADFGNPGTAHETQGAFVNPDTVSQNSGFGEAPNTNIGNAFGETANTEPTNTSGSGDYQAPHSAPTADTNGTSDVFPSSESASSQANNADAQEIPDIFKAEISIEDIGKNDTFSNGNNAAEK